MATDPRADNCRAFRLNAANQVVGVELIFDPQPTTRYELVRAELIDEIAAVGQTVATCTVLDGAGIPTAQNVWLAWPWPNLTSFGLPGNPNGQHMIVNGYAPPNVGPLALFVGDANHALMSDRIGGLGLPNNRHVSYRMTWRLRGAVVDPGVPPSGSNADIVAALDRINATLRELGRLPV